MVNCKYCEVEILNAQPLQEMCHLCSRIQKLEYDRLQKRVERRKSILEFFEWHKCIVCHDQIEWGVDICHTCNKKRQVIKEHLIKEFKKSIEEQKSKENKTK